MTPEEEDMEAEEDMKVTKDTEAKEGVEEHLVEDEDQSSITTVDNKVTLHETIKGLHVLIAKLPITLLKSA